MRPAVSIGGATALDGLDDISHFGNDLLYQYDISSYFAAPEPTDSDLRFLENGISPHAHLLNIDIDCLAHHNESVTDDFKNFDEFINHDDQFANEIQSTDQLAETTASLQPQFGASFDGCDDGAIAVSV